MKILLLLTYYIIHDFKQYDIYLTSHANDDITTSLLYDCT